MLLYVLRWDVAVDRTPEAYERWTHRSVDRALSVPGVQSLRAFRPVAGESQVVVVFEFADFETWAAWFNDPIIQGVFEELYSVAQNVERELWEPSPIVPGPVFPKE